MPCASPLPNLLVYSSTISFHWFQTALLDECPFLNPNVETSGEKWRTLMCQWSGILCGDQWRDQWSRILMWGPGWVFVWLFLFFVSDWYYLKSSMNIRFYSCVCSFAFSYNMMQIIVFPLVCSWGGERVAMGSRVLSVLNTLCALQQHCGTLEMATYTVVCMFEV